jgi:uncharacterized protein YggT (Ycf19 family)
MADRMNPEAFSSDTRAWKTVTSVNRMIILAALIVICAFALYFYAHHNWNPLPAGTTIDRILVQKSARKLSIFRDGKQIKTDRIALSRNQWAQNRRAV